MSYQRSKIALIGAGNIGGTLAHLASQQPLFEIVLFDIKPGFAAGKALDLSQAAAALGHCVCLKGTDDYRDIEGADFVIVTAGFPRQPGMSRDDLLEKNAHVISSVGQAIKKYCPKAFVVCVTNPLDAMVYLLQYEAGLSDSQIVGMAGELDSARFKYFLAQHFNCHTSDVDAKVLGGHGDTMVPLIELSYVRGLSLKQHVASGSLSHDDLERLIQRTRDGGAEIVRLLGQGSAFYAPAVGALKMILAVYHDTKALFCAASKVSSAQYAVPEPLFIGVPIVLGAQGVEKVISLPLSQKESEQLQFSINAVSTQVADLRRLKFLPC